MKYEIEDNNIFLVSLTYYFSIKIIVPDTVDIRFKSKRK